MTDAFPQMTPNEVADELDRYHVLDVREASEFEGPLGHVAAAQWIPLSELEGRVGELPVDRPLLLVCRSGNRSGKACARLADQGRPGAINLVGGMIAWHASGLPVARARIRSARALLDSFAIWLSQVTRIPHADATTRVREAKQAEAASGESATPSVVVARTITRLERELRAAANVPADLGLVCDALRGDAAALDARADSTSEAGGTR